MAVGGGYKHLEATPGASSNSRMPPQLEKNHVVPTAWQDEALARDGVSREVPCSALNLNLDPRSPGLPRPGCAPGAFPAAVATTESTTGKPSPTPARSQTPPRATRVHPAPA